MNDDVKSYIYGTIVIFLIGVFAWVSFLFLSSCGFSLNCERGELEVYRTPVPTLIPATMQVAKPETTSSEEVTTQELCAVNAQSLIEAWVASGESETEAFQFTDDNGLTCSTTFEEAKSVIDNSKELSNQTLFVGKPTH